MGRMGKNIEKTGIAKLLRVLDDTSFVDCIEMVLSRVGENRRQ